MRLPRAGRRDRVLLLTAAPRACVPQERQTRAFGTHARALAEWDRHIFRNRRTLSGLEAEVKRVAGAQDALERQLSILEVHQREVHEALEGMEREAEALYGQEREGRRADDVAHERDRLFELAEDVSQQLLDIGAALRETIQLVRPRRAAPPRVAALLTHWTHALAPAGQLAGGQHGPRGGPGVRGGADLEQPAVLARVDRLAGQGAAAARGASSALSGAGKRDAADAAAPRGAGDEQCPCHARPGAPPCVRACSHRLVVPAQSEHTATNTSCSLLLVWCAAPCRAQQVAWRSARRCSWRRS